MQLTRLKPIRQNVQEIGGIDDGSNTDDDNGSVDGSEGQQLLTKP